MIAGIGGIAIDAADILRVEANGVDSVVLRQKDGAFVVEALRNDGDAGLTKHLPGANNGIERAKAGVIADDAIGRDARGDEVILHGSGLIVGSDVMISADQKIVDLVRMVKASCGENSVFEEGIDLAAADFFGTAEDERDATVRDFGGIGEQAPVGGVGQNARRAEIPEDGGGDQNEEETVYLHLMGRRSGRGVSSRITEFPFDRGLRTSAQFPTRHFCKPEQRYRNWSYASESRVIIRFHRATFREGHLSFPNCRSYFRDVLSSLSLRMLTDELRRNLRLRRQAVQREN